MITYMALLRGINVSGKNKIDMRKLKAAFESLGLSRVKTYVQSGNVVFNSTKNDKSELKAMIRGKIERVFGLPVIVILRTLHEMLRIIATSPFLKDNGIDTNKLHITFLSDIPVNSVLNRVEEYHERQDKFIILSQEVYLHCPNGYGRTKFSNDYFEKKLGVSATTRSWRTVMRLVDIANR